MEASSCVSWASLGSGLGQMRSFGDDHPLVGVKLGLFVAQIDAVDLPHSRARNSRAEPLAGKLLLDLVELDGVGLGQLSDQTGLVRVTAGLGTAVRAAKVRVGTWVLGIGSRWVCTQGTPTCCSNFFFFFFFFFFKLAHQTAFFFFFSFF